MLTIEVDDNIITLGKKDNPDVTCFQYRVDKKNAWKRQCAKLHARF